MTDADLEQRILTMIANVSTFKRHELRPEHRLREDLGMDSVSSMELLSMLAEDLDLDISVEDAAKITTVASTIEAARRYAPARSA